MLPSGTRLGSYEITHVLGAGGMGEVYRARDSKLGRSVALKVILDVFATDADRVARFEREAKVLASGNHPNIAALYGLEEWNGQHVLIMELVEGETLAERLQRGALPVEEALRVAVQTAEALEAAHERGIIHRDLKPANIKITPDDKVKVLDFGLAKTVGTDPGRDVANSPTLSMMATNAGIILGTAAYMSPEQVKGFAADHRSDVFSLGVVLYEMLTGRKPFQGETAPDILASVLVREPELQHLPPDLNPRIPELLRRCLDKQPKRRWQAVGDLRAELEALVPSPRAPSHVPAAGLPGSRWRRTLPVAGAAFVAALLGAAAVWQLKPPPDRDMTRFAIALSSEQAVTGIGAQVLDISPDGRHVAFTAGGMIFVRPMASLVATPIQDTQSSRSAFGPAFSPDGQHVAFFTADGFLKRAPIAGGLATTVCRVTVGANAMSWLGDAIFFSSGDDFLRVPATGGGAPVRIEMGPDERVQRAQLLPDGDTLLLSILPPGNSEDRWTNARVLTRSLRTGARKLLVNRASDGWYVPTGHLLYLVGGTLHAVAFDPSRLEVSGPVVPIIEGVRRANLAASSLGWFSVSSTGTLVYMPGPMSLTSTYDVGIVERTGTVTAVGLPPARYRHPRVSRSGERLVVETDEDTDAAVRVHDFARGGSPQRITFAGNNRFPIWTPDGQRVAFQSDRDGDAGIYWQAADGSSEAARLTTAASGERHIPEAWHPAGDVLLFSVAKADEYVLWTYSVRDKRTAPFGDVRSQVPTDGLFSPNGKWVAYSSGRPPDVTIYVQPFPATGAKYELPPPGATAPHHPLWTSDTTLLINQRPGTLDVVTVATAPSFSFGKPVSMPRRFFTGPPRSRRSFDAMPDGRLVGLIQPGDKDSGLALQQFTVVLNWFDELKARVPGR